MKPKRRFIKLKRRNNFPKGRFVNAETPFGFPGFVYSAFVGLVPIYTSVAPVPYFAIEAAK